jgi:hypothetical protein
MRYLVELPVRVRGGTHKAELEWHRPNWTTLQNLFANPTYAGAYVYGVRSTDRRRQKAGRPGIGRRSLRAGGGRSVSLRQQLRRFALLFHQLHSLLVERDEGVRAKPFSFIGDNAIGKIAARIQ